MQTIFFCQASSLSVLVSYGEIPGVEAASEDFTLGGTMDRWAWMAIKAYLPAVVALAGAFASMWVISGWKDNLYLAGMVGVASWVPIVGFVAATGLGSWTTYRLWRWERGEALTCDCGGLLGRERPGVRDRGDYRRCLACGRNVNHRHYS